MFYVGLDVSVARTADMHHECNRPSHPRVGCEHAGGDRCDNKGLRR